ncbi:hypothetical protein TSUD_307130 [Trifolium subterraneum]|uniref:PB1-like domain-containing protein n=1 Tax=Trifolium subterraneum TaxID=3900 RepID=A0A2Z6LHY2_TRISU|nr:hypothetical protein TSUD_307130 [Trifolium subterraneum]
MMDSEGFDKPNFCVDDGNFKFPVCCEDEDDVPLLPKFSRILSLVACSSKQDASVKKKTVVPVKRMLDNNNFLHSSVKKLKVSTYCDHEKNEDDIPLSDLIKRPGKSTDNCFSLLLKDIELLENSYEECTMMTEIEEKRLQSIKRDIVVKEGQLYLMEDLIEERKQEYKVKEIELIQVKVNILKETELRQIIDKDRERKEEELEALSQKIAEFTLKLKAKEKDLDAMNKLTGKQAEKLDSERKNVCAQEKEFESVKKQFEGRIKELKQKQCERRAAELVSKEKHYEGRLKELESREKKLEEQMEEFESKKEALEGRTKELESKEKQVEGREMEIESKESQLLGRVEEFESKKKKFEDQLKELVKEHESKQKQCEGRVKELEWKQKQCEGWVVELVSKAKDYEGRLKELESREKKLGDQMEEFESQMEALEGCKKELESKEKQIEGREMDLESKEKKFEGELYELVKEHESKSREFVSQVKEHESKVREFDTQVKEFESKKKHFENQVEELKSKERKLKGRVKELKSKENQVERKANELKFKKKQFEGQVKDPKSKLNKFDGQVKKSKSRKKYIDEEKESELKTKTRDTNRSGGRIGEEEDSSEDFQDLNRDGWFKVRIHNDGFFVISENTIEYKGGKDCELLCDPDRWSYHEILRILKNKGYPNVESMYYKAGGKFKELMNDDGAMEMVTESIDNGIVNLYVAALHVKSAKVTINDENTVFLVKVVYPSKKNNT